MRLLNQLSTFLSGIIVLIVCSLGMANANSEYAIHAANTVIQPSSDAYEYARAARAKAEAERAAAYAEAYAKAEAARAEEKAARAEAYAKAHAAWAQSNAEARENRAVSYESNELKNLSTH